MTLMMYYFQVLKLYYSLTLQEYRTEDATPSAPGIEGEAAEELGSDKVSLLWIFCDEKLSFLNICRGMSL